MPSKWDECSHFEAPRGQYLSNLSTHTPFDPAVPLLGICSRYIHEIFQDFTSLEVPCLTENGMQPSVDTGY